MPYLLIETIKGLNYISLHKSGLCYNSFRIESIAFFIVDRTLDPKMSFRNQVIRIRIEMSQ